MKPNTLEIINRIWEYRNENNSNICFTLDAGANVHVLYPETEKEKVNQFIDNQYFRVFVWGWVLKNGNIDWLGRNGMKYAGTKVKNEFCENCRKIAKRQERIFKLLFIP